MCCWKQQSSEPRSGVGVGVSVGVVSSRRCRRCERAPVAGMGRTLHSKVSRGAHWELGSWAQSGRLGEAAALWELNEMPWCNTKGSCSCVDGQKVQPAYLVSAWSESRCGGAPAPLCAGFARHTVRTVGRVLRWLRAGQKQLTTSAELSWRLSVQPARVRQQHMLGCSKAAQSFDV